jgi:predicted ATPase with chaperone activity
MFQNKGTAGSATLWGVDAEPVYVEVQVGTGANQFEILGHHHPPAVRESRERIRAALRTCGVDLTSLSVRVNLAPIDLPKELPALDLPIALALLAALGHLPQSALDGRLVCGELGLDVLSERFAAGSLLPSTRSTSEAVSSSCRQPRRPRSRHYKPLSGSFPWHPSPRSLRRSST